MGWVNSDSAAEKAGLGSGDVILGFEGTKSFQDFTQANKGKEVELKIRRSYSEENVKITLSTDSQAPLGVALVEATKVKLPFFDALKQAVIETGKTITAISFFLYNFFHDLFVGKEVAGQVAGPVGMFTITRQAVSLGLTYVLQFVALLSINLGIMNILPFPALDGGRAVFIIAEAIRGKKILKMGLENTIHWVGFFILIALIVLITYNDIIRLIRG